MRTQNEAQRWTYPLRNCVWELTLACCFNCQYCGSRAGKARDQELSTEECLQVVEQLVEMGCRRVSMIGGEVFMRPDWPVIAKALTDRGVKVAIITNGFLFTPLQVHAIKDANIESVAISIDGPQQVHDRYRQPGSFERALQAMKILTENEIPVSVISTLHRENVDLLEELYQVLSRTDIFAWQLQACSPMGNAKSGVATGIDFRKVIRFVEEHLESAPFALGIADNIGYYTESEGYLRGDISGNGVFSGCGAGLTGIGIDSVGNVRGCESMYDDRFIEGNLRSRTIRDIWTDPEAFAYNRQFTVDELEGACRECPHGSRCAGGCRSYNYFTHGNLYESPRCARVEDA